MLDTDRAAEGFNAVGSKPVSYTHLRAHETDSYLVCRLLLEKTSYAQSSPGAGSLR